jgi:hypothetical protein
VSENEADPPFPKPGEIGLTWISGWTGFWVTIGQWLNGDGGMWPFRRPKENLDRGFPTHVFMVLENGKIIEAQPGGAVISHVDRYMGRKVVYSRLPLTDAQRADVPTEARKYRGIGYSFLGYLYLALWRLHIRPLWLARKVESTGHMICSQLVDQILSDVGFHLFEDGRLPQDVTPGDIYWLLVGRGWVAD